MEVFLMVTHIKLTISHIQDLRDTKKRGAGSERRGPRGEREREGEGGSGKRTRTSNASPLTYNRSTIYSTIQYMKLSILHYVKISYPTPCVLVYIDMSFEQSFRLRIVQSQDPQTVRVRLQSTPKRDSLSQGTGGSEGRPRPPARGRWR